MMPVVFTMVGSRLSMISFHATQDRLDYSFLN